MTTLVSQTEIDALDEAIASGATRITFNGRTVEYADFDSLVARREYLQKLIDGVEGTKRRVAKFIKGVTT